jgi:hypothetical protein
MKANNRFLIKTEQGFKDFDGLRRTLNTGLIIRTETQEILCTNEHRILVGCSSAGKIFRKAKNLKIGDKIKTKNKNNRVLSIIEDTDKKYYYDPINVKDCNSYISSNITHHNCAIIDECAFIRPTVYSEFIDSFLPSQAALSWKKNIILSTPKGMNHFYNLVKGASPDFETDGSGVKRSGTNGYSLFKVDWRDVPRYDKDGNQLEPDVFMDQIVSKHGLLYWKQNFECSFLGSSYTILSSDTLKGLESQEPINTITPGLKVYKKPQEGHKYILSVDPSKDGIDAFAVNILDITDMNFEQVAAGQIQIDYLLMPEYLVEWGEWYNFAFIIIENNEGAGQSIADTLYKVYEYENMFFDVKVDSGVKNLTKIRKKYPGFRTTSKTRKLILATMKLFIENGNLVIHDKTTIEEFFTFILINGKYTADEGAHDDAVMALAIAFAPFCSTKNFADMKMLISSLYKKEEENKKVDISEIFIIGGFDDGVEMNENYKDTMVSEFGGVVSYYDTLDISNFG